MYFLIAYRYYAIAIAIAIAIACNSLCSFSLVIVVSFYNVETIFMYLFGAFSANSLYKYCFHCILFKTQLLSYFQRIL